MWVTRNKDNKLKLFKSIKKPIRCGRDSYFDIKSDYYWWFDNDGQGTYFDLDSSLFPDLTWEDEPLEVSLKSNKKIDNELNDMFCQLCVDYNISDEVADEFIKTFKKNICG